MKMWGMLLFGGLCLGLALSGCSRSDAADAHPNTNRVSFQQCQEPRPEICYEVFAPVCATLKDPLIRCLNAPCPSSRQVSFTNDCKACADPKVQGFVQGECQ
jgi:hypothetical protein